MTTNRIWKRGLILTAGAVLLLTIVLAPDVLQAKKKKKNRPTGPQRAEDLRIVDCLLPGQIRQLGRGQSYSSRRRPIRTSAVDCRIRSGEYVAHDAANYRTALRIWLESAEGGNAEAQYYVGEIYEKGLGTEPDYQKAIEWYKRSAEQGYSRAQTNLGFLYEQGLGVEADPRTALDWYRKASDLPYVIMLDTELAELQQQLADSSAQLERLQSNMGELQTQFEETEASLRAERSSAEASSERIRQLEDASRELQGRIRNQETQISTLSEERKRFEQLAGNAKAANASAVEIAGPSIEVFDTAKLRTRSRESEGSRSRRLVGRVTAPAGLKQFSVNGQDHRLLERGLFEIALPVAGGGDRIRFSAIDSRGKQTEVLFDLTEDGEAVRTTVEEFRSAGQGIKLGRFHALVIGNADYSSLPDLETAGDDARAVAALLEEKYRYSVELLINASQVQILSAFKNLIDELDERDNLLVYYAGHGEIDQQRGGKGYWLPVDADTTQRNHWISSAEISDYLAIMKARQVLVMADSCYSGTLTSSSVARFEGTTHKQRRDWLSGIAKSRVRVALTSGGIKPVLDSAGGAHSVFAEAVLSALTEIDGPLETFRLWSSVSARVAYSAETVQREQNPQYAPIRHAGHEGGEFVFVPAG